MIKSDSSAARVLFRGNQRPRKISSGPYLNVNVFSLVGHLEAGLSLRNPEFETKQCMWTHCPRRVIQFSPKSSLHGSRIMWLPLRCPIDTSYSKFKLNIYENCWLILLQLYLALSIIWITFNIHHDRSLYASCCVSELTGETFGRRHNNLTQQVL
jgi:hypothetical protein